MRRPASARADDGPGFHARALDAHRLGRRGAGGARTNDRRQGRVRLQLSPRRRGSAAHGGMARRRAQGSPRVPAGARSPVGAGVAGRHGAGLELRAGIYCFGIFALSTTRVQRFASLTKNSLSCSGVLARPSTPSSARRFCTSGDVRALTTARWRRSTVGRGVFAGAARPFQDVTSYPGTPPSITVGTSASPGKRFAGVTAIARRLPERMCEMAGARISKTRSASPFFAAVTTSPVALYGTICTSTPALDLNSSAARCWVLPMPMVATFILPGFALAAAMTSLTVFSGDFGSATITSGKKPTVEIIAKSFSGSYGSDLNSALLIAVPLLMSRSV